jgi:hypothetical protein
MNHINKLKFKENAMTSIDKISRVNETVTVYRYDNGWMVEIGGRDKKDDWVTVKLVCNTEGEVIDLIKKYNQIPLVS